ncbi:type IV pilus biogenesis protein PilM [Halalkalibacter krulwichiae]|uniref:Competence protein A n=1 Tax=Halalkalibacter krulwichiae TaxID=199441 RepID=A0A1X9MLC2_9BACI|nr:pilus assembly protein PilM [Halalkalibacter krulwichiae]ARK31602.1 Competence protein A [Halalkalibacter krulwichiae]
MLFNNKYTGIDVRDNKVTFATIKLDKQAPVLEEVYEHSLQENIVANGVVVEKGLLSTAVRSYLKGNKKASKKVHLSIPTQNTLIRKITTLPDLEEKDLAKLIRFQIGESIHIPFEDPIYDFVKIGSVIPERNGVRTDDDFTLEELANNVEKDIQGPRSEILFFATSRSISEDLMESCEEAGYKPLTAELRGLSLQRLLMYLHPSWLKDTAMILDVSEETVDIHIFKHDLIVFSRTMALEEPDERSPRQDEDVLAFSDEVAEETVTQVAAAREGSTKRLDEYVSSVITEIQRAQNFFRYSLGERDSEFSKIIVTGESASLLIDPLSERMRMEISTIDYSSIVTAEQNQQLLDSCSVAIGLALRANDKPDKNRKGK